MSEVGGEVVGRERELSMLVTAVERAERGEGGVALLAGEPGIGKTRLADEAARAAKARGFGVHWGRCWEAGGAPAYWPWIQIFRSLRRDPRAQETTRAYADVLARILPELRTPGEKLDEIDQAHARFLLFDDLWALLRAASDRVPMLLVLDDLHAADPSSMGLLRLIARDLRDARVLVVATARDRDAKPDPAVSEAILAIAREATQLTLRRLDAKEVATLVGARVGFAIEEALATRIRDVTDGNPLFVDQVCRLLAARPGFERRTGDIPIPAALRDAIRGRLSALDAPTRAALEVAAVLGREITTTLLAAISGNSDADVAKWIANASDAGILVESSLGHYEICHALFRDALARDLQADRRAELHARAASALEASAAPERGAGEIAQHLLAAASIVGPARVVEGCRRAARRALDALAFEDAASILTQVDDRVGASLDPGALAEILVMLAEAHARAGQTELAERASLRAAEIAHSRDDAELLARAALALGARLITGFVTPTLVALLRRAQAALPEQGTPLRARVLARLAAALQPADDPEVPIALAREAVAMARVTGDAETLRWVLYDAGSALVDLGDPRERVVWDGELLALSEDKHDHAAVLRAHTRLVFDYLELGRTAEADRHVDAHCEVADRIGVAEHTWRSLQLRVMRALWEGRFDDAASLTAQADAIARRGRIPEAALTSLLQRWGRAYARGEALPNIERAAAFMAEYPVTRLVPDTLRAYDAGLRGDLATARALVANIADNSPLYNLANPGARFLTDVARMLDDARLAARLHALLLPWEPRFYSWGRMGMFVEGPVSWLLGILEGVMGRTDEACARFEAALDRCVTAGIRPYELIACVEYARVLARSGRRDELRRIVERGTALARALGLEHAASTLAQLAGGASTSSPPPPEPAPVAVAAEPPALALTLTRDGEAWVLVAAGRTLRLKDSRGVQILAQLVAHPGRELHVLSLVGSDGADMGDAGEALDDRARHAYRERVADLRERIEQAETWNDEARASELRAELDAIARELSAGVGLGGRGRRVAAAAERARVNVQRRLRDALRRIAELDPALGRRLERSIRTGTFCAFDP